MILLAIDPGSVHCGLARFDRDGRLVRSHTLSPDELLRYVWLWARDDTTLVIESFRLDPRIAPALAHDPLRTVEVIGALKWIARRASSTVVMQAPAIKRPAKAMVRRHGIRLSSNQHTADAQLHGYFYLLTHTGEEDTA